MPGDADLETIVPLEFAFPGGHQRRVRGQVGHLRRDVFQSRAEDSRQAQQWHMDVVVRQRLDRRDYAVDPRAARQQSSKRRLTLDDYLCPLVLD